MICPAKEHSQAIGFLLNRRGFTFLEEEYSKDHLDNPPDEVWKELSDKIRKILESKENIVGKIDEFIKNNPEKITEIFNLIKKIKGYKKYKEYKKGLVYYEYITKISEGCENRISNKKIEGKEGNKLSKTSKWIVENLITAGVNCLNDTLTDSYQIDLLEYLNSLGKQQAKKLKSQLPDVEEKLEETKKNIKESRWNFNFSEFELDKKEKILDDEADPKYIKTHLHHFCYTIYKINHEITSGSRHRSKYFDEIKEDLKNFTSRDFLENKHSPAYLKKFAETIDEKPQLDIDKLGKLVCHISNFELKPLRAYFNDKTPIKKGEKRFISHKNNDQFDLEKLSRIAATWFMRHWTVNEEKDKADKVEKYKTLREQWGNHTDKNNIIDFWLNTNPVLTIPPYQSMNNRRPPKCQTLLLNGDYLNEHYSNWGQWLKQLSPDKKYKEKLQELATWKR